MVPIFKWNVDIRNCSFYTAVKLLEHGMKVMERVLKKGLGTVNEMKFGFMSKRGTMDTLFIMRLQEKYHVSGKMYVHFMDLENAFDRVPWELLE